MPVALQVAYPAVDGTNFDHDYYLNTHMPLVGKHMGAHIQSTLVTKGIGGGGPDAPAPFYAVATMVFADKTALDAAMGEAGPVVADIPNFTNTTPQMMVGDVVG